MLRLAGIEDRNAAEKLRGLRLYVDESEIEPLPEGSWYWFQLLGLTVTEKGRTLGEIAEILPYTANDVYVVQRQNKKDLLIPALKDVVKQVDLERKTMEVELPAGLEDEA